MDLVRWCEGENVDIKGGENKNQPGGWINFN